MTSNWMAVIAAGAAAVTLAAAPQTRAADFPVRPVTVVVAYPAGGPTDVMMRALGPRLTEVWKQAVVVANKAGANEIVGADSVAKARPDGYTLLMCTEVPLTMNPFLFSELPYNPAKDFVPVSFLLKSPLTLVVPASLPVSSLQEFINLAKARGASEPLTYGSAGAGGVLHLPMVMFAKQNGLEMTHVPYKGVAPLLTDLMAGRIDAAWVAVAGAAPYVRDGKLKALVVDAPARVKALPEAPVFSETSVKPVKADFIFALVAPAGTPPAIAESVASAVKKILADPAFREQNLDPFGYVAVGSTPGELAQHLAKDRALQAERIKAAAVKLD